MANPAGQARSAGLVSALLRLARPLQWTKSGFVLIGPAYAWANNYPVSWPAVVAAAGAFALAASAGYVLNDLLDHEADRAHPRKRRRPIAAGEISVRGAYAFAALLVLAGVALAVAVPLSGISTGWWVVGALGAYVANTVTYSFGLKRAVMADVVSLACGFVLRVLGGCAAAGVAPTSWLLNCTFFIAMFLAFGKRLGERRTSGADAATVRSVQRAYTDELLRMAVVVTAVAALVTYAGYVEDQGEKRFAQTFNYLWLTMLPATYGLLRCIVLLERGDYDDPTELAAHDRAFQLSVLVFAGLTVAAVWGFRTPV